MHDETTVTQDLTRLIRYARQMSDILQPKPESTDPACDSDEVQNWLDQPDTSFIGLAELSIRFSLTLEDSKILAFLAGTAMDSDNPPTIHTIGEICRMFSHADPSKYDLYLSRLSYDAPLRKNSLLAVSRRGHGKDGGDLRQELRTVDIADRVLAFLNHPNPLHASVDEKLSLLAERLSPNLDLDSLKLPKNIHNEVLLMVRSQNKPTLLTGPQNDDKLNVAKAVATILRQNLLCIDLAALLELDPYHLNRRLSEIFRESALGNDFIHFDAQVLPENLSHQHQHILSQWLNGRFLSIGIRKLPQWLAPLTSDWTQIEIPLPGSDRRLMIWQSLFQNDKKRPDDTILASIAERYEIPEPQIRNAALLAHQLCQAARRKKIDQSDLDHACQATMPIQQTDKMIERALPDRIETEDLILPDDEKAKFEELLLYARAHDTIYSDWGFGEEFTHGRGLSVLFYGESGTGKTMAANILCHKLGLILNRIHCAKLRYKHEQSIEECISQIFDDAQKDRNLLLFEDAELLFSGDHYSTSHFIQKLEQYEGVVILKTTQESLIDEAFKRRLKYRIFFPMPNAETRTRLYQKMIPKSAPLRPDIPFNLLGEYFELSGSHIRRAILNAAFYAYRDKCKIGLAQLTEATIVECRGLGMLINDNLPMPLTNALRVEQGLKPLSEEEYKRIHKPVISQDLPLLELPEGIPIHAQSGDFDFR